MSDSRLLTLDYSLALNYKARDALNQTALQIATSAVYSVSIKSVFALAVIGSSGVVTHSTITTVVCCAGALVYI